MVLFFLKSGSYRTVLRDLLSCPTFCWGDLSKNDKIGPNGETVGGEFSGEIFTFFPKNGHFFMGDPLLGRTLFCRVSVCFAQLFAVEIDQNSKELGKKSNFHGRPILGKFSPKGTFLRFLTFFGI